MSLRCVWSRRTLLLKDLRQPKPVQLVSCIIRPELAITNASSQRTFGHETLLSHVSGPLQSRVTIIIAVVPRTAPYCAPGSAP